MLCKYKGDYKSPWTISDTNHNKVQFEIIISQLPTHMPQPIACTAPIDRRVVVWPRGIVVSVCRLPTWLDRQTCAECPEL